MSDTTSTPAPSAPKTPGVVIFAAILNFLSVSFLGILSLISLIALIFGNVMGLYDIVTSQMNHYMPTPNYSYGLTFIFGVALAAGLSFVLFFILLGIGLLKGNKIAWYVQIAMCVLGLLGFPFWTALNAILLFLFFRQSTRDFFKV